MKKGIFKAKTNVESQKKLYIFLIGLAILSLIFGIIFIFLVSDSNLEMIHTNISGYFNDIKSLKNTDILINSLYNNLIYIGVLWLLGMSIVGLPIIIVIFCFKFFITGFSISSIIYTFKAKGILKMFIHLFPHQLVYLIILLLICFYSVSFCIKLFKYLFLKKMINFKEVMSKYFKVLFISCLVSLFVSLYESYISLYLLNLFN